MPIAKNPNPNSATKGKTSAGCRFIPDIITPQKDKKPGIMKTTPAKAIKPMIKLAKNMSRNFLLP